MRIIHFTLGLGGGGRERRMIQLIRGLYQQCDCEQMIVTLDSHCDYPEIWNTSAIVKFVPFRPRHVFKDSMEEIIRIYKPDILHSWIDSHQNSVLFPILKRKYHFKYIVGHLADCNPISTKDYFYSLPSYLSAEAIVSNSAAGLQAKKAINSKSHVIHNGFDFSRFDYNMDIPMKRKELNLDENAFVVCMCARFHESKDWKSFIELARLAQKEDSNMFFLAVGDGNTISDHKILAQNYNLHNLLFLGRITNIEDILLISDASILFTNSAVHAEGISNSLMEAMAAGLPTIATRGGGTPELIQHGINGYMIDAGDYHSAWTLIRNLKQDTNLRKAIGNSARKHIQDNFSLSQMTQKYIDLYSDLLRS